MTRRWHAVVVGSGLFNWGVCIVWAAVVIATSVYHEVWRDEVRALSYAMDASSLPDLWRSMENEGHPILWYLLLYSGYTLTSSKLVLPVLSVIIAGAAVFLWMFYVPLPSWLKALFVFGGLPLYEYSVMARNYGISMLLFFAFASIYSRRKDHPIVLGVLLALLCNTNIHSLILASLLASLWVWDVLFEEHGRLFLKMRLKTVIAITIVVTGMAAALYTLWPTEDTVASDTTRYSPANMVSAWVAALIEPSKEFGELFPARVPAVVSSAVLLVSIVGLSIRPPFFVTAFAGLWSLSIFFNVFYQGAYRHQGLFVVFLVTLYSMVCNDRGRFLPGAILEKLFRIGLYGALPALFICLLLTGAGRVYRDWMYPKSAGEAFHDFLKSHPAYREAILIGEPDYYLESVHYYTDNPIFIVREKRFGNTVRFIRQAQRHLRLGELLCAAWNIQQRKNKPVLIALGHPAVDRVPTTSGSTLESVTYSYGRTFSWSREELANWNTYTKFQGHFAEHVIGDETYSVYSVTIPSMRPEPMCRSESSYSIDNPSDPPTSPRSAPETERPDSDNNTGRSNHD